MSGMQRNRWLRWCLTILTTVSTLRLPAEAAGPIRPSFRKKTSVDVLAAQIKKLERELEFTGSIAAKVPDVWGQARLTQHREEFEKQMSEQLNTFTVNLNAEISRSDQAYLSEAIMLAAGINQSTSGAPLTTAASPIDISTISNMVSPINGVNQTTDAGKQAQIQPSGTFSVVRTNPIQGLSTSFPGTPSASGPQITLEPEVILDQRKRFLNHLHEIRRINEGDDTADAPGYSLNLVRIPVSVLPGDHTREGYGAEIAITATAHLTEELLPQTFRSLVINDLVDQLSFPIVKHLEAAWPYLLQQEELELQIRMVEDRYNNVVSPAFDNVINNVIKARQENENTDKSVEDLSKYLSRKYNVGQAYRLGITQKDNAKFVMDINSSIDSGMKPVQVKEEAKNEFYQRNNIETKKDELAKIKAELATVVQNSRNLLGGVNQRSRRSRFAIPASQLSVVFGDDEIASIAFTFFKMRDRKRCNWDSYIAEVQSFLHQELDASFELLTHKHVCKLLPGGQLAQTSMWGWIDPNLGQLIRAEAGGASASSQGLRIIESRQTFFRTIHNDGAIQSILPLSKARKKSPTIQQAAFQVDSSGPGLPPPPSPDSNSSMSSVPLENLGLNTAAQSTMAAPADGRQDPSSVPPPSVDDISKATNITEALAWAILVESALLNDRLNEDLVNVSHDPNCGCHPTGSYIFYGPQPPADARLAFMDYVRCRWPIHVFALDPETQQQNVADTFSMRREAQLAIALAFTRRFVNAQSLTRYMRRIEMDMRTIALNNTIVGFGHGANTFGWRFTPRIQTPPFESNLTVAMRDLIVGGPNTDALLRRQRLEPGIRECTAIVVMPSFIRHVKFDTRCNWFRLSNKCMKHRGDTLPTMDYAIDWSRDIREMQDAAACCTAEQHLYRDGDVERLMSRVEQLSQELPMQSLYANVPNENTIGGFEMFSSGVTDLAPELIGFYGVPGIDPSRKTELFLVGNHFSVHDTRVMAGNQMCQTSMLSRQVMQVTIPPGVQVHKRRQSPPPLVAITDTASISGASPTPTPMDAAMDPAAALQPDRRIPCSPNMDPNLCPKYCNPCCNTEYVELRLATPYGITSSVDVPVVRPTSPQTDLAWATDKLQMTYYYKITDATAKKWSVDNSDIRLDSNRELVISVKNGLFIVPTTGSTMEFTINGIYSGLGTPTAPAAVVVAAPFNATRQQYLIDGGNFVNFQTTFRDAIQTYLNNAGTLPPAGLAVTLKGTVITDTTSNTRLRISGEIPVQINFVLKP